MKWILKNIDEAETLLKKRGFELDTKQLAKLEKQRKSAQTRAEELKNQRNVLSKQVGMLKAKGENADDIIQQVNSINHELESADSLFAEIQKNIDDYLLTVPNVPQDDVPTGNDENDNEIIRTWGEPTQFDFNPKDHADLGTQRGWIDFETATKISSARFVVLHHPIAKLQRALTQWMLDVHTQDHGYKEVYVPYLVNRDSLFGTGQLPKFENDLFHVTNETPLSLISTAEISVTNLVRDTIISENELPIKWVAHTPCFRSEAGSYGRDTRGMLRQHQFEKVELVQIVKPEASLQAHEELTQHAERILQLLNIPYRVAKLCTGDLGFASSKTYDLEAWLPGQNCYREISSCSNFKDFQGQRMKARFKNSETKKTEIVHTLNGSGLAVGRTLIAVMENYQNKDGSIRIPDVLQGYMNNQKTIN